MPKFNFVDPDGAEWRIRRGKWFRWAVEQQIADGWLLRATAPTRKLAQSRMEGVWAKPMSTAAAELDRRLASHQPERIELSTDEQRAVFEYARQGRSIPEVVKDRILAAHGRHANECLVYYQHLGIGRETAYLMCVPRKALSADG